jgi:predicted RNase H-like HicB family nuclease
MQLDYTLQIWREGEQFIAHAMPLDVASSGATIDQAREAVREAVKLFVDTARDQGTLAEILEEAGYIRQEDQWHSPPWISTEKSSLRFAA